MASENGIIGDNFGTDLPVTQVPDQDLSMEKNLASFSKTKEYQRLKEHLEDRMKFYQTYLPDGRAVADIPGEQRAEMWVVANTIIGEFRAVLGAYETAAEALKEKK